MTGLESEPKLGEIEAQLPKGILLLHSEKRTDQAVKFQRELLKMGIFIARQGQLIDLPPEKLTHFTDIAKLILFLPDETLDKQTAGLLEHIMRTRSGYSQVFLTEEDKKNRNNPLLADRRLDWTREYERGRLLRTFGKQAK